ncbi:cell envelope integrity protein CreD [bacterium]|nr:cell envelope integrity protein CreD [bacterium]
MTETTQQKIKHWTSSVSLKIAFIGLLILLLMIPITLIDGVVDERIKFKQEAQSQVSQMWGQEQNIIGPVFQIPYISKYKNSDGKIETLKHKLHFTAHNLNINSKVESKTLKRGVFEVPVYESKMTIKGDFKFPDLSKLHISPKDLDMVNFALAVGVSDARTLRGDINLEIAGHRLNFEPGTQGVENLSEGIHILLGNHLNFDTSANTVPFEITFNIVGSQKLKFFPLGENVSLQMSSDWTSPSFMGNYIPNERNIDTEGFEASWKLPRFGRDLPQAWSGNKLNHNRIYQNTFGVDFILPVDSYTQTVRAIKYTLLFILLTFGVFFLMEILHGLKIHPIQYLVVGLALCLFYLLLLSFSEQIDFVYSYIISAIACISVISLYSLALLKNKTLALSIFGLLNVLYGFLYVLLQAEEASLLFGSIGLFLALTGFMYKTRKIDWYNIKS